MPRSGSSRSADDGLRGGAGLRIEDGLKPLVVEVPPQPLPHKSSATPSPLLLLLVLRKRHLHAVVAGGREGRPPAPAPAPCIWRRLADDGWRKAEFGPWEVDWRVAGRAGGLKGGVNDKGQSECKTSERENNVKGGAEVSD